MRYGMVPVERLKQEHASCSVSGAELIVAVRHLVAAH